MARYSKVVALGTTYAVGGAAVVCTFIDMCGWPAPVSGASMQVRDGPLFRMDFYIQTTFKVILNERRYLQSTQRRLWISHRQV